MKNRYLLVFLWIVLSHLELKAQYVPIPDSNFAIWLNVNVPSAMSGNLMDTMNVQVTSMTNATLRNKSISSLEGIQYFKALQYLNCDSNSLTYLPALPSGLSDLSCNFNNLTTLPSLPSSLRVLYCSKNQLNYLPSLPGSLQELVCRSNFLTTLPVLPGTLLWLICESNQIPSLSALPNALQYLYCGWNPLTFLPPLPNSIRNLNCDFAQLLNLPPLPTSLQYLSCDNNLLTNLPALPNSLDRIFCSHNQLTTLPILPNSITHLSCHDNQLVSLSTLSNSLVEIVCTNNQLTSLPSLPNTLLYLECSNNHLINLPVLPSTLISLTCDKNYLTSLPTLPISITHLNCQSNDLSSLPALPNSLHWLNCSVNKLTMLSALPIALAELICSSNQMVSLPLLPNSLHALWCYNNRLTSLPFLPDSMESLIFSNNNIACLPPLPSSIISIGMGGNAFNCLPNYIAAMDAATLAIPLCGTTSILNNPNDCQSAQGAVGYTYTDANSNCIKDSADAGFNNIPLNLYSANNTFLSKTYSFADGRYNFVKPYGIYKLAVDTVNMPFTVACASPGVDSVLQISSNNLLPKIDFPISCKNGFDVGVQSIATKGRIFPGVAHTLLINAGDVSHWYNLNCASGVKGKVQITVTGPVTYVGPAAGALTPVVQGNVYTFKILDFGTVNNIAAFNLVFKTNTTAQANDAVCVQVSTVASALGDYNGSNNLKQYCYTVTNSYDPNTKEVFPTGNIAPGSTDWLTYTIHFQNTGNAAAMNIHIIDTLDTDLEAASFELINFSHANSMSLEGNILNFYFKNVNLPDSGSDLSASQGFLQYRIKAKGTLQMGVQISNRAHIFFDFNPPVATNTTLNSIAQPNGITLNENVCDSFSLNGYTYLYSGTFTQILPNAFGLDSTITLNLAVNHSESIIQHSACETYTLNNQTYDSSGVYTQIIPNAAGCDSTITLELTINRNSLNTITTSACDSYTLATNTYTSTGTYFPVIPNSHGCDSTITLNLTIRQSTTLSTSQTACKSFFVNGNTYTESGIYVLPFINSAACPSTWNLHLTINSPDTTVTQNGVQLSSNQLGASYQWLDCNNGNVPILAAQNQNFYATTNGNYAVVVSKNQCSDTSDCISVVSVGEILNTLDDEIEVFPNPASQSITIHSQKNLLYAHLKLVNLSGQLILEKYLDSGTYFSIELIDVAKGLYFLELNNGTFLKRIKLIKE